MADGVGMGRRNWLALEPSESRESDDNCTGEAGCRDDNDVCEVVAFRGADTNEIEGAVPSS